ncbi:FAD binding domain-containing protein [Amylocarpus encephaloides]|uniref:Fumarate reductase n=1 Tax=Amylocarpus encephaloides TaxID=45428 RepID=A0A9P8C7R5_9HELO|nr:FAD binding domain-containing protein [Amylocarpus encephaloides]
MSPIRVLKIVLISLLTLFLSMILKNFLSTMSAPSFQNAASKQVIVVGSGLAGLSAASTLVKHGITVHLLERSAKPGGNSMKASSGINGAPTKYQSGTDTTFYSDTIKSVGSVLSTAKEQRESLITTLTNSSSSAVSWLVDEKGVDLSIVAQLGGHSFPRTHRGAGQTPPGASIITTLLKSLKESSLFHLETSCLVTNVLKSENEITGVEYSHEEQTKQIQGPVVFASGGFAGDAQGMLSTYRPDLAGFPSTNEPRPGSQNLLTRVGAQLLDMDLVQVHPTSFVDPKDPLNPVKFLAAEMLRGEGGLLLQDEKRFVNEMDTRKNVTEAIMKGPSDRSLPRQWTNVQLILDEGVFAQAASHVGFYLWKGLMEKTTVSSLGEDALQSLQEYANIVAGDIPDPLERQSFGHWTLREVLPTSVVYVGRVTPAVHFTMGGVVISPQSEVLNADHTPIKGLWAAGEVTGGIHGENRLGGSSLLECAVFGRLAGEEAAKYVGAVPS